MQRVPNITPPFFSKGNESKSGKKRPVSPIGISEIAPKKQSPLKSDKECMSDSVNQLTMENLRILNNYDEPKVRSSKESPFTSGESISISGECSEEESSSNFSFNNGFSSCDSFQSISDFDCVRGTLRSSPVIPPLGNSENDVYKVTGYGRHSPFYFKNLGQVNEESILNLELNKLFRNKLKDSSVELGNYKTLDVFEQTRFQPGKYNDQHIMLVQEEINSRFKSIDSIEVIDQLYMFYNNGKDSSGKNIKEHFQRALLFTILTGQYDEHSGNLNQDTNTKQLCRYDLDLSFSGGAILKDFKEFKEYEQVFTRFGLRSVLLFAITNDTHTLLINEPLPDLVRQDLSDLISTNLDSYFSQVKSKKTDKLKQFISSNFLNIKTLLSNDKVCLADILRVCYPEVALTLEKSHAELIQALSEDKVDQKGCLRQWFDAVNKCFADIEYFEDMDFSRKNLDGSLTFLGKITNHLFNQDGSVKDFSDSIIAHVNMT